METLFASQDLTAGQLNAIVKKLGGHEAALKFLRGGLTVSEPEKSWHEYDGVIYFSVTSDGATGAEWIDRLKKKGVRISTYARQILLSKGFKPTTGVTTEVAVLKGMLFEGNQLTTKNIHKKADEDKMETPNAEVACLIREKITDEEIEEMGLIWIATMHEPIKDSGGEPSLLYANRSGGGCWLSSSWEKSDNKWSHDGGYAFAVSQVGTQQ